MKNFYFLFAFLLVHPIWSSAGNLATPILTSKLTDAFPLEMPTLKAYPVYMNASVDSPDSISAVTITIDGAEYAASVGQGFYFYLWTPASYGTHQIVMKATTNTGQETTLSRNIIVTSAASTQLVTSLQNVVIEFGGTNSRWYYGTYNFPQFVGAYNNINATLNVQCPNINGGCDDWDRWAFIDIKAPDGNWVQLIRYITPYRVGCNHQLDVTDYMSFLQGEVEIRVFIDTWGTGGWQLTLGTNFSAGTPQYDYSDVVEVWDGEYPFGNPANLQPVENYSLTIPSTVQESHLRLSNTGHGWGQNNTANAAEFFNATHYIDVNGTQAFTQHLWTNCNPNPDGCVGQQGTWQYNRAGWCPGAISPPNIYSMTPYIGTTMDLKYRFHPSYQDFCNVNNPNCVSGQTCTNCNDGSNPVYYVDGQIINRSNTPIVYGNSLGLKSIDNTKVFEISVYPNPSKGMFQIKTTFPDATTRLTINSIDGKMLKGYSFKSSTELSNYHFDISSLSSGIYFVNLENSFGTAVKRIVVE